MKTSLILQQEATECGLACLAMILRIYGSYVNLESLRKQFEVSLRGTSIAELVTISHILGLDTTVYLLKESQLTSLSCPAILYWNSNHYVVLSKIHYKKGFYILDPASGADWIKKDKISEYYSGYAITFKPKKNYSKIKQTWFPSFKTIFREIPHVFSHVWLITLFTLLLHALMLLFPCFIQKIMDPLLSTSISIESIQLSAFVLFIFKVCESFIYLLRGMSISRWEKIFTKSLGLKVLRRLLDLKLNYFENRSQSSIYSKFNSVEKVREILSRGLAEGLVDGLFSVFIFILIFFYNIKIGLIVSMLTCGYLFLNYLIAQKAQIYNQIQMKNRNKEVAFLLECLRGIVPIKIFCKEKQCVKQWVKLNDMHLTTVHKVHFLQILLDFFRILVFGLQTTFIIFLGLIFISKKQLTLGMFYALLFYINILTKNISSITTKWFDLKMVSAHTENLNSILDCQPVLKFQNQNSMLQTIHTIELKNVFFRYHKNEPWILENINLKLYAGECVMLLGPSGYGKSTLMKILMGLLQPTSGQILINNVLLEPNNTDLYRVKLAAVMQNDELFCGTINQNISFFAEEMDHNRIQQCAQWAGIAEDIEAMPMGYHSYVGDMGVAISGGQKQRILLARALYSKPSVLFLDEAFSNLDVEKENLLYNNLRHLRMTQFIITHRRDSLSNADKVLHIHKLNASTRDKVGNSEIIFCMS